MNNVISSFDAMLYGVPHPGTLAFLQSQFTQPSQYLTQAGQMFHDRAQQVYEAFNGSQAIRTMKSIIRCAQSFMRDDRVYVHQSMGELQFAQSRMQRWIMAEPMVREMYHQQRIDGYSDSYVDYHSGIGEDHYDYRRVMQGYMVVDTTDRPDVPEWSAATWDEELLDGDSELSLEEQNDIQDTWMWTRHYLQLGKEDPTSIYCNFIDD